VGTSENECTVGLSWHRALILSVPVCSVNIPAVRPLERNSHTEQLGGNVGLAERQYAAAHDGDALLFFVPAEFQRHHGGLKQ
jgi:hypothetical protein